MEDITVSSSNGNCCTTFSNSYYLTSCTVNLFLFHGKRKFLTNMYRLFMLLYAKNKSVVIFYYSDPKIFNFNLQCKIGTPGCCLGCPWIKPGNGGVSVYTCRVGTGSTGVLSQFCVFIYVSYSPCRYALANLVSYFLCNVQLLLIYLFSLFSYCVNFIYLIVSVRFTSPTIVEFHVNRYGNECLQLACKIKKSKLKRKCSKNFVFLCKFKISNQFCIESVDRECELTNFKLKGVCGKIFVHFLKLDFSNLGVTCFRYFNPSFAATGWTSLVHNQVADSENLGWSTTRVSLKDQYLSNGG